MSSVSEALEAHLRTGVTTLCRCWAIERRDGAVFGFTDHDQDLSFEGVVFKADTGLSAFALQQSTGLAVDNTEALGVLSDAAVTDADIDAGRFDEAEVLAWLVNWADVDMRCLQFRGHIGEVSRSAGGVCGGLGGFTGAVEWALGRGFLKTCHVVFGGWAGRVGVLG
ncbi:MAG: DUF2163 domain-containing protein, partial [Arenibacterium sp.]